MRIIAFVGSPVEDNEKDVSKQSLLECQSSIFRASDFLKCFLSFSHISFCKSEFLSFPFLP